MDKIDKNEKLKTLNKQITTTVVAPTATMTTTATTSKTALKTTSTTKEKPLVEKEDGNPFKRRGSVARSPPMLRKTVSGSNPASDSVRQGEETIALQAEKKKQGEKMDDDIFMMQLTAKTGSIATSEVSENKTDLSEKSKTCKLDKKCNKLEEVRKERASLEEFLFNDNNKISKSAIKYILSKWMLLEGKLQEEILESEKLRSTYQELQKPVKTTTYAQAVSAPWSELKIKATKTTTQSILLIKPKNDTDKRDNEEIKSDFCKLLEKQKSKIKFKSIRKMRNKGLVAELDSENDMKIIQDSELNKIELKAEIPTKSGPTIIIYDVDKTLTKEEIVEQIIAKNIDELSTNKEILKEKIKCRFNIKTKNINRVNWVIELPTEIYKNLIVKERIYIGFLSYKIKTFVNITRCFKCYGYGHAAKNCTTEHQICEKCGEEGHMKANCSSKISYCINCKKGRRKELEHSVKDVKCPEYLKQLDLFYKRIQWT